MQLGMIGLGRMGGNMARRLARHGHQVVVFDSSKETMEQIAKDGATPGGASLEEFVGKLTAPRAVWLMVPAAAVDSMIVKLHAADAQGRHFI